MEKLRAALDKAQAKRANLPPIKGAAPSVSAGAGVPNALDDAWAELAPLELDDKLLVRNRVLTYSSRPEAMPLDMLRTKILLLMRQNNWSRVAITSPEKNCGKTTISCNLALGLSRQSSIRTMLLDFDLRKPSVASTLGQDTDNDIEAFLKGDVAAEEHLVQLHNNLAVSMFEGTAQDPMRLVMSPNTSLVLDSLERVYQPDVLIFDLPPMLPVDETRAMLRYVDCALIIARAEQTRINMLDVCEREVAQHCNVLGTVLNKCRYAPPQDNFYGDNEY